MDRGGDLLVLDNEGLHREVTELLLEEEPGLVGPPSFIGLYKDNYVWDDSE